MYFRMVFRDPGTGPEERDRGTSRRACKNNAPALVVRNSFTVLYCADG